MTNLAIGQIIPANGVVTVRFRNDSHDQSDKVALGDSWVTIFDSHGRGTIYPREDVASIIYMPAQYPTYE